MEIVQAYSLLRSDIASCDFSFQVDSEIQSPYENHQHTKPVTPYTKCYSFDDEDFADVSDSDRFLALAKDSGAVYGFILVSRSWNGYASIDDFAVDVARRNCGVGAQLLAATINWTKSQLLPGIRLETQNNNVQACRIYARHGFNLAGHDKYLYRALGNERHEVALFWYYFIN